MEVETHLSQKYLFSCLDHVRYNETHYLISLSLRWVFDSTILLRVEMQHGDSACVCAEVGRPARSCGARIWLLVGQFLTLWTC